ncbi:CBS domain-containing protein [Candidatus Saccharibacteria bacterium]|nr:CBS domain-containing protein [Candidatus Saccharibacteria bacterium]
MWFRFLQKFVKFIDPKLEKYREHAPKVKPKYTPKTLKEFIEVLRRTPKSVLSDKDRSRIAAIMSFDERLVGQLMVKKDEMVFVNTKDVLGPLVLDKLYKSGFTNFPVVDNKEKVKGVIHTEALNALEIKKTDRAEKYMSKDVFYLHETNSLAFAVEEIERTNSYYFLVLDKNNSLAGFFTIQMLLDYLLG